MENSSGEDICLEYEDFDCTVTFVSFFNCSLGNISSVVNAKGVRKYLYTNVFGCKSQSILCTKEVAHFIWIAATF